MSDADLERKLSALRVPEHPPEYWEEFTRSVVSELEVRDGKRPVTCAPWTRRWAWGFGFATACALIALMVWRYAPERDDYQALRNETVIRGMLEMFPNRVRAIVQDENGTKLILSEEPDVPDSDPIWIEICNGGKCRVVITFSGQSLHIAKERVEVLADAQGQIMLVGDRLFWSATAKTRSADHLRIHAKTLEVL